MEVFIEFDKSSRKKYKVEAIYDSATYTSKQEGHLPGLYY